MIAQHTCLVAAENNNWVQRFEIVFGFLNCLIWPPTSHQTLNTVSETTTVGENENYHNMHAHHELM